jgi:hypothetical protein
MERLRIELRREPLDQFGGEGERTHLAPLPDLDVFEEIHDFSGSGSQASV